MEQVRAEPVAPIGSGPWNGADLLALFRAAGRWLELHIDEINALNVFPVPDGDTGTNMHLTLHAALTAVAAEPSCGVVAERVYRGALMGARGNSGVILSQILRGFSLGLAGHPLCGPVELAAALSQAATTAYRAVMRPVEGTMLTVIRETGEAAQAALTHPDATAARVLEAACSAAFESVQRTPTLLARLRDAGVVDAGGHGLYILLSGMLRAVRGEPVDAGARPHDQVLMIPLDQIHGEDDYGYCTNFVLQGIGMPFDEIRNHLAAIGESVVVVGDADLIKVHIHTLRPGEPLNYAVQFGALSQIEITNMDVQRAELRSASQPAGELPPGERPPVRVGVVAVAPGNGFQRIFQELHVGTVITGGQTMNPSTADLLEAIDGLQQQEVIVLPNNSNILLAARQAVQLSAKRVSVLPTRTVPQGIAAMFGYNFAHDLVQNAASMQAAAAAVVTAEITTAVRGATVDGVEVVAGQTIGVVDGTLVASGDDPTVVIEQTLDRMGIETRELVTIYYGQDCPVERVEMLAERMRARFPDQEVQYQSGGQPFYDYIIAAE